MRQRLTPVSAAEEAMQAKLDALQRELDRPNQAGRCGGDGARWRGPRPVQRADQGRACRPPAGRDAAESDSSRGGSANWRRWSGSAKASSGRPIGSGSRTKTRSSKSSRQAWARPHTRVRGACAAHARANLRWLVCGGWLEGDRRGRAGAERAARRAGQADAGAQRRHGGGRRDDARSERLCTPYLARDPPARPPPARVDRRIDAAAAGSHVHVQRRC